MSRTFRGTLAPAFAQALVLLAFAAGTATAAPPWPPAPSPLTAQPSSQDFGLVHVDQGEQGSTVWVQNNEADTVQLGAASVSGDAALRVSNDGCNGQVLATGMGCNVGIGFDPDDDVHYAATLQVPVAGFADLDVPLAGTGGAQRVTLEPSSLDFGSVAVGDSAVRAFTLTSTGNLPFQSIVAIPSGGDVGGFRVEHDGCSLQQLVTGSACDVPSRSQLGASQLREGAMAALARGEAGGAAKRLVLERDKAMAQLVRERLVESVIVLLVRGQAVVAHAQLGKLSHLCSKRLGRLTRRPRWHDAVREPHRECLLGTDRTAREDQVERAPEPHDARQPHRPAVDQRHAPAAAEDAEHRVLLDDPQVAPQRQLKSARNGVSGDGGDHRLTQQHARGAHRPVAIGRDAVALGRSGTLEVGAGAEGAACTPQHAHARLLVGVKRAERVGERLRGRPVDRVADLRLIEDHRRDGTVALDHDAHGARG